MMGEEVIGAIKALEDRRGRLTPEAVVEAARDEKSPLHRLFEWNDAEAAHEYRVIQARMLLRRVRVEVTVESETVRAVAYVRDPDALPGAQGYRSILRVRTEERAAVETVADELERVLGILGRTRKVLAVLGHGGELDEIARRVDALLDSLREEPRDEAA